MYRKSIYLLYCVFALGLVLTSSAEADLVAWWRLEEGSGTAIKSSTQVCKCF